MKRIFSFFLACLMVFGLMACAVPGAQTAESADAAATTAAPAEPTVEPTQEPAATPDPNMVIEFNDDVLENMIRTTMGKPEGDILVSDAQTVMMLELLMDGNDWSQPRIKDLSALKYFTNLNYLTIGWSVQNPAYWDYDIDISALAGMTKMETLAILCINVSDVSPLAEMSKLKSLVIMGTSRLADLTPLGNLTQLESLEIKTNAVVDLSPLAGLANLQYLDLSGNFIQDVSPLAGLTKLTTLYLGSNPIRDYSILANIRPNLTGCDFEPDSAPQAIGFNDAVLEQKIREALKIPSGDITLDQTESITTLSLGNDWQEKVPDDIKIQNISALKYFPNLEKLDLQNNNITRIDVLRIMSNLTELNVANNNISDIRPLTNCPKIKTLNLNGCQCWPQDLAPLAEMTGLRWLDLSTSWNITDISIVSELTNLQALYLQNLIVDLSPVKNLTNLTTLYIMGPIEGKHTPDYSPLKDIYPNLTDKNFDLP